MTVAVNNAVSENTNGSTTNDKKFTGRPSPLSLAYDKKMADIDKRIALAKSKLDELRGISKGQNGAVGEKGSVRGELIEESKKLREQMRPHTEKRRSFIDQSMKLRDELKKKTGEVQDAKDRLPFRTIPEMEARIKELEARIESGQFKLIEEKQILAEISKINKARRALDNIDGTASDVGSLRLRLDKLSTQISAEDDAIAAVKVHLDKVNAKLDELAGVKADADGARQDRNAQFDRLKKEIDQAYEERRKAYEEYRSTKQQMFEARQKRDARRVEYERIRSIEDKIEDLEEKLATFNSETATDLKISECNNLTAFFSELVKTGSNDNNVDSSVNKVQESLRKVTLSADLAGAEVISKKDDDIFRVSSKKGASTNKPNGAAANPFVKLPFHILSALADLGLSIPTSAEDLPALYATIEKKKLSFSSKQDAAVGEKDKQRQAIADEIAELRKELEEKSAKKDSVDN